LQGLAQGVSLKMVEKRLPMSTIPSFPQEIRLMRMAGCPHPARG
jgi:hypothetical protein